MFASRILVNNDTVLFNSTGQNKLKCIGKFTVVHLDTLELKPETVPQVHDVY